MASSGLVAVDVVVRERDAIAALTEVVRTIRRFADAPLQTKIERALERDDADNLERFILQHNEDVRLDPDPLDGTRVDHTARQRKPIRETTLHHLVLFGCQEGREVIVEWSLVTPNPLLTEHAICLAIKNGHLSLVKMLHGKVEAASEHVWLDMAAFSGRLEVLDWLYANRKNAVSASNTWEATALEEAARLGHVDVLNWFYANHRHHWLPHVLDIAVLYRQTCVCDWIWEEQVPANIPRLMNTALHIGSIEILKSLHDHYSDECRYWMLVHVAYGEDSRVVLWLLQQYPDRYGKRGVELGAICGDLSCVQQFSGGRCHERQLGKSAMCKAAKFGHLHILEWLYANNGSKLPLKALWEALYRGHLHVIKWGYAEKPEVATDFRLAAMHSVSCEIHQKKLGQSDYATAESLPYKEVVDWIANEQRKRM